MVQESNPVRLKLAEFTSNDFEVNIDVYFTGSSTSKQMTLQVRESTFNIDSRSVSAYLPQVFIAFAVYSDPTLLVPMIVLSVIYVFPYLLCFIFSKKRKGWMIAALVLFLIDSAFFAIDVLPLLMTGDISFLFDAIIRVYALVTLIVGITGYSKLEE